MCNTYIQYGQWSEEEQTDCYVVFKKFSLIQILFLDMFAPIVFTSPSVSVCQNIPSNIQKKHY